MDRRAWLMTLALAAIWGSSYMFIKIGLRDLSPGMVAWTRLVLAAAVLVPIAWASGALRGASGRLGLIALVGLIQVAAPFVLIGVGEEEISSGLAGILVASTPMFTALLAIWVDHEERSQGLRLVGVALGVVGVGVLLGVDLSGTLEELLGGLAILLASLGYAVGALLVKHRLSDLPPMGLAAMVMTTSAVLLTPLGLLTLPDEAPGAGPAAAVLVLGVICTGVAFAIFYPLLRRAGPARTWILTYLAPGFAVVYGVVLLDESVTAGTIAGLVLIVGGSWLAVEGRAPWRQGRAELVAPEPAASAEPADSRRGAAR